MRNGFTDIPVASADSSTDAIWLEKRSPSRTVPERVSLSTSLLHYVPFARAHEAVRCAQLESVSRRRSLRRRRNASRPPYPLSLIMKTCIAMLSMPTRLWRIEPDLYYTSASILARGIPVDDVRSRDATRFSLKSRRNLVKPWISRSAGTETFTHCLCIANRIVAPHCIPTRNVAREDVAVVCRRAEREAATRAANLSRAQLNEDLSIVARHVCDIWILPVFATAYRGETACLRCAYGRVHVEKLHRSFRRVTDSIIFVGTRPDMINSACVLYVEQCAGRLCV